MLESPASWQAIQAEVLQRIRNRQWPPGELIPNEADLAEEFGCARATVNRALRELAEAGYLDRRRKAGTRVALNPVRKATLEIPVIHHEVEARGGVYGYALISREMAPAPLQIRSRMGLPAGAALLHARALHLHAQALRRLLEHAHVHAGHQPGRDDLREHRLGLVNRKSVV